MKLTTPYDLDSNEATEIVGFFGTTELVRRADGTHELSGGIPTDRLIARVWCALFAPEIEFSDSWEELDLDPGET